MGVLLIEDASIASTGAQRREHRNMASGAGDGQRAAELRCGDAAPCRLRPVAWRLTGWDLQKAWKPLLSAQVRGFIWGIPNYFKSSHRCRWLAPRRKEGQCNEDEIRRRRRGGCFADRNRAVAGSRRRHDERACAQSAARAAELDPASRQL